MAETLSRDVLLYAELTIIALIVMVIIAISAIKMNQPSTLKIRFFAVSVMFAAMANVFDFVWNISSTDAWNLSVRTRYAINFWYFTTLGISTQFWYLYNRAVLDRKDPTGRIYFLSALPVAVLMVLLIVSYFNGCVFYIGENGAYYRGSLFYFQHILSYCHMLDACLLCIAHAMSDNSYEHREEVLSMAAFIIPPLLCMWIQAKLQSLPILSVGIVFSFMLSFINILESRISNDELTGIPNRREMVHWLSSMIRKDKPQSLCFMFLDIDDFKKINDELGHAEGDRALRVMAASLRRAANENYGMCARWGGDEFAFAAELADEDKIAAVQERIRELVREKSEDEGLLCDVRASIGCARYSSDMKGLQELIGTADADMYSVKALRKKTASGR